MSASTETAKHGLRQQLNSYRKRAEKPFERMADFSSLSLVERRRNPFTEP
jgi:hypothetical protein